MKKGLSRFVLLSAFVVAGVFAFDIAYGSLVNRLLPHISNQGETGKTYYSLNDVDTPVLIVGSSRAAHHYVSNIISDSIGLDVENIGRDGCFFSYNCCVIHSVLDRYVPRLIIWDIWVDDLCGDNPDPLENLHPYYNINPYVTQCINEEYNWKSVVPLSSYMYKYY